MPKLHHVNITIPVGGENEEAVFLVQMLGYDQIPVPAAEGLPVVNWFEFPDGTQIHLSEDPDHHPSVRSHVALELGSELEAVVERLDSAGYEVFRFETPDARVAFCNDPAGNRWELRDPVG
jgi:catechol 2,3-dioxygenase-like lactoylglutathione lyase family enzyme